MLHLPEIPQKLPISGGFGLRQFKEIVRHDRWDKRFVNCIIFINAAKPERRIFLIGTF